MFLISPNFAFATNVRTRKQSQMRDRCLQKLNTQPRGFWCVDEGIRTVVGARKRIRVLYKYIFAKQTIVCLLYVFLHCLAACFMFDSHTSTLWKRKKKRRLRLFHCRWNRSCLTSINNYYRFYQTQRKGETKREENEGHLEAIDLLTLNTTTSKNELTRYIINWRIFVYI